MKYILTLIIRRPVNYFKTSKSLFNKSRENYTARNHVILNLSQL